MEYEITMHSQRSNDHMPTLEATDGIKPIEQLGVFKATNGELVKSG